MISGSQKQYSTGHRTRVRASHGFSLVELVFVVAVGMILAAVAVPVIQNSMRVYAMRSAITSITSAVSSARFQAIFAGCKSQVVFTKASYTYQFQSEAPAFNGQACNAAFANVGAALPLQGRGVALNSDITLTFSPGGGVSSIPVANPIQLVLLFTSPGATLPNETIKVSNYGNITVTP